MNFVRAPNLWRETRKEPPFSFGSFSTFFFSSLDVVLVGDNAREMRSGQRQRGAKLLRRSRSAGSKSVSAVAASPRRRSAGPSTAPAGSLGSADVMVMFHRCNDNNMHSVHCVLVHHYDCFIAFSVRVSSSSRPWHLTTTNCCLLSIFFPPSLIFVGDSLWAR